MQNCSRTCNEPHALPPRRPTNDPDLRKQATVPSQPPPPSLAALHHPVPSPIPRRLPLFHLRQVRQTYRIAVELYLKCGMVEDALEWAERGKVRGALDNMTRVVHDQGQGDPTVRDMQDFATQNSVTIVSYSVLSRSQICIWVVQPFGGATKHSLVQWPRLFDLQMREFLRTSAEVCAAGGGV